jgi:hypothetical protein
MVRRVVIDGNASSPLRISVAGVDAATAQFNALIFDANQPPLRLWGTGYVGVMGITFNQRSAGKTMNEGSVVRVVAVPPGFSPIFLTHWRVDDGIGRVFTPSSQSFSTVTGGGGGGVCSNYFVPIAFSVGPPGVPDGYPPTTYVNYCVFKNYN